LRVVVLGGGSSGEHFVGALRRLDREAELTVVERRLVGGECSYFACMPTKTMLRGPELVAAARRAPGVEVSGLVPSGVFHWRELVVDGRDDSAQVSWLESKDCALVRGDGVVAEPGVVHVDGRELPYDRLVIATGSSPDVPPVFERIDHWTNREATETSDVPATLLVVGGGPVGCELAQFFARVGSKVTLVESGPRLLPQVDAEAAALVQAALEEDGVDVRLGQAAGDDLAAAHDRILVSERGIEVDERMRAAGNVWAIGDVTGIALFTHVGKYHARIAAYDMTGRSARADHRAVPMTIFTDPQVAAVGTLEGRIGRWELTATSRLSTYERPKRAGFVKVAADPTRRVLTGAVAVGPESGEWLQQLTLAIRAQVPVDTLLDVIPPFPAFSEAVFLALRELDLDR
jgi:pyruvate/2-oxoglutarate dehydrogenase complex dihydrolipoamide dehydrogenase (E3) component